MTTNTDAVPLSDEQIEALWQSLPVDQTAFARDSAKGALELRIRFARALLSASKPAVPANDVKQLSEGYRRGIKDAFHLVNMLNANRQGRTADETCSYIVRTLAERVNSGEIAAAPTQLGVVNLETLSKLHRFLNAAGGEGFVLDGVDAGDLFMSLFDADGKFSDRLFSEQIRVMAFNELFEFQEATGFDTAEEYRAASPQPAQTERALADMSIAGFKTLHDLAEQTDYKDAFDALSKVAKTEQALRLEIVLLKERLADKCPDCGSPNRAAQPANGGAA